MNTIFRSPVVRNTGPLIGLARIHPCQRLPDRLLRAELDIGEAAVISAALELGTSAVIIDERKARRVASYVYGTAGLLVEAKNRGMIETVRPYLEGMIQAGYFLGPNLVAACLSAAGEAPPA